ncbi:MAG: hypothetical protein M3Y21_03105 [Candidatus Eremiobacteraeota bacterium]|nr:hypothetical protein [Candidatus Eremiobacteraeota bacterium]
MDIALKGDAGSCLNERLGGSIFLVAVADGFGTIGGESPARLVLRQFRFECARKLRRQRVRSHKMITAALIAVLNRVNSDIFRRSAAHDDYITGGASITAMLMVADHAYIAHIGRTAAYLSRDARVVRLTKEDTFEQILTRSIGTQPQLEVSFCAFPLCEGDAVILASHPLVDPAVFEQASNRSLAIVRYHTQPETASEPSGRSGVAAISRIAIATVLLFGLMSI